MEANYVSFKETTAPVAEVGSGRGWWLKEWDNISQYDAELITILLMRQFTMKEYGLSSTFQTIMILVLLALTLVSTMVQTRKKMTFILAGKSGSNLKLKTFLNLILNGLTINN